MDAKFWTRGQAHKSFLMKRSGNSLNKEWKKKYVTLTSNGVLLYHPSINDYLHNTHGKEMDLLRTTVKVPGKRPPRAISSCGPSASINGLLKDVSSPTVTDTPTNRPPTTIPSYVLYVTAFLTVGLWSGFGLTVCRQDRLNGFRRSSVGETIRVYSEGKTSQSSSTGDVISSPSSNKEPPPSPLSDKKKKGRKKNMTPSKTEGSAGQADVMNAHLPAAKITIEDYGMGKTALEIKSMTVDIKSVLGWVITPKYNLECDMYICEDTEFIVLCLYFVHREERESWIRAKYEQRLFLAPLKSPGVPLAKQLFKSVQEKNLPNVLLLLAYSNKEQINSPTGDRDRRTALHVACELPNVVMTQLLVWYGIDVKAKDVNGHTALFYARKSANQECVDILLQHGCPNEPSSSMSTPIQRRKSSCSSILRTDSRTALV
ncbi:hypothetical protein AB205_0011900 [Aquarana catesbeiana]|uniref:Uncharacterized protein n=1 Tax=Aquarana catesbeiana TaxID=8400 RepID=A0A2G9RMX4_AQUCT|nr:hypothetical protein AB205_0011900 [Aquarana catesbeiana]